MNNTTESCDKQRYCPLCLQHMKQDDDNNYRWYCYNEHLDGNAVMIDLSKKFYE